MNLDPIRTMTHRLWPAVGDRRIRSLAVVGMLASAWALYPLPKAVYSIPQETVSQWLIEFRPGDDKVHIELRYERREGASSNSRNSGFQILPSELVGLTRDQAMSDGAQGPLSDQARRRGIRL